MDVAIRSGDLKAVQDLIRSSAEVNEPRSVEDGEGSLLMLAIEEGYEDVALALLKAGADVHVKDSIGWTALHWACDKGLEELVRALIERGSRVNERDSLGCTPLMLADKQGDEYQRISMRLLRAGASCERLLQRRVNDLFYYACCEHDLLAIHILLKNGCSVRKLTEAEILYLVHNLSKQEIEELLHHACHEDDVFVVHTLLKNSCSISILSSEEQEQLLHHACREDDLFVIRALLQNGCSISILSREEQEQLLHHARRENDLFVVRTLLQNGCSVRKLTEAEILYLVHNLSKQEIEELLHHACHEGDVFVVRTLLKNGCSISILSSEEQEQLLHHACREDDVFGICTLLKNGCSISILSREEQEQLLHHACREDDLFVVRALLQNGCSISILSREEQEQLLHHARRENDLFVVRTLLQNGCSVRKLTEAEILYLVHNLSKQEIEELLHHACHEGDVFVVRTLLKNGCSISILSSEEQEQLLHHACREDDVFGIRTLLKNGCSISILSREEQEQLLHHACRENDVFVVCTLLKNGCSISILSREEQEQLLHHACREDDVFGILTLLKNGCSICILSREEQEQLLHHACREDDVFGIRTLLRNGCSVSILSREEQEQLLHHAYREDDVFVIRTLLQNGCSIGILSREEQEELLHHACREDGVFVIRSLLQNGCSIGILSREEQEELLQHACREDDVFVIRALLQNGCSISILSREEQEELLYCACHEGDVFVVRTLLQNDCNITTHFREKQEQLLFSGSSSCSLLFDHVIHVSPHPLPINCNFSTKGLELLFHHACHECDVFVVHTLLKNGCSISILSTEEREQLLHHACCEGDVFVVHTFLKNGCSISNLSTEEQEQLLHRAFCEGDVFVVRTLLKNGCSISNLSTEEQEQLLHHACHEGDVFVVRTLLKNGCSISILSREEQEQLLHRACHGHEVDVFVVHTLLKNGCNISILSREEQEQLLLHACHEGDVFVLEAFLANGCNIDCAVNGSTPLMAATQNGCEEVVKKLILADANLGIQDAESYNTAFHIAATCNNIQCGILLAEGGASVRIKNKLSQTPFDLAKPKFKETIKQALSFTTRKALCIIGNAESGKSTLIAALQAESNSFLGKIINRFRRVDDHRQRTAGIETVPHCSQRYGEVLFFDFAGQDDYHGPHQMFLESLISKPGVLMTLLLVVKLTEEKEAILHQLHRWLFPVALMATYASPSQVIIIGSFLDKVKSKQEATAKLTSCIEATRKDLEELPLEFVGSTFLNCRQPQSEGIDQICNFLQEIPIPEFRATHTHYSLAWVLSHIRSSFTAKAVQLHEFSVWVQDNKDNLPRTMPSPKEVCQDLSAAGHGLYLPNREEPFKSWLVLDLPSILHGVYGTLFSQSKEVVNEFGLLHCQHLAQLFRHLDLEMVQQLLISLEFCLPVDPSVLKVEVSKLTQSKEASGWLFFPALISAKPPHPTSEIFHHQSDCYLCWQLRTAKTHSISACVLQTILLRLAAHFVVKHHLSEGAHEHCCSIWWNGIAWQSKKDVDVTVHITNNRVIQVFGVSLTSADRSRYLYLIDVISDILSTVHRLAPKLAADCYIVHPPRAAVVYQDVTTPTPKELFPVATIQSSIEVGAEFSLSLRDSNSHRSSKALVAELFGGCVPSLEDIKRINWTQPEPNLPQLPTGPSQPESSQPEPSQPEPSQPEPSQPKPNLPQLPTGPNQSEPNQPEPSRPELSQPEPSRPEPSRPEPSQPELKQPETNQPQLSQPEPSQPDVLLWTVYGEFIL